MNRDILQGEPQLVTPLDSHADATKGTNPIHTLGGRIPRGRNGGAGIAPPSNTSHPTRARAQRLQIGYSPLGERHPHAGAAQLYENPAAPAPLMFFVQWSLSRRSLPEQNSTLIFVEPWPIKAKGQRRLTAPPYRPSGNAWQRC